MSTDPIHQDHSICGLFVWFLFLRAGFARRGMPLMPTRRTATATRNLQSFLDYISFLDENSYQVFQLFSV